MFTQIKVPKFLFCFSSEFHCEWLKTYLLLFMLVSKLQKHPVAIRHDRLPPIAACACHRKSNQGLSFRQTWQLKACPKRAPKTSHPLHCPFHICLVSSLVSSISSTASLCEASHAQFDVSFWYKHCIDLLLGYSNSHNKGKTVVVALKALMQRISFLQVGGESCKCKSGKIRCWVWSNLIFIATNKQQKAFNTFLAKAQAHQPCRRLLSCSKWRL